MALTPWNKATLAQNTINVVAVLIFASLVIWKVHGVMDGHAKYNWDILAYTACALEHEIDDPAVVHERVYESVEEVAPRGRWKKLIKRGEFRAVTYKDPGAFTEQLPFYRQRVLYTGSIFLLYKCGVQLAHAAVYSVLVAYVLLSLVVLLWLGRIMPLALAAFVGAGIVLTKSFAGLAPYATPDMLHVLMVVTSLYFLVEHRNYLVAFVFLALAVLARADAVVFAILLGVFIALMARVEDRPPVWTLAVSVAAIAGAYLGTSWYAEVNGWWIAFRQTFTTTQTHPSQLDPSFDMDVYWQQLTGSLGGGMRSDIFFVFSLAIVAVFVGERGRRGRPSLKTIVMIALAASVVARYLLFPTVWLRLYAPLVAGIELVFFSVILERLELLRAKE